MTVRLSSLEIIVHGQTSGICLQSSSCISSKSSAKLSTFWGIRCLHEIITEKTIEAIQLHSFSSSRYWLNWKHQKNNSRSRKFDYELFFPVQNCSEIGRC